MDNTRQIQVSLIALLLKQDNWKTNHQNLTVTHFCPIGTSWSFVSFLFLFFFSPLFSFFLSPPTFHFFPSTFNQLSLSSIIITPFSTQQKWPNFLSGLHYPVSTISENFKLTLNSGLSWHTTDESLRAGFEQFGAVDEAVSALILTLMFIAYLY